MRMPPHGDARGDPACPCNWALFDTEFRPSATAPSPWNEPVFSPASSFAVCTLALLLCPSNLGCAGCRRQLSLSDVWGVIFAGYITPFNELSDIAGRVTAVTTTCCRCGGLAGARPCRGRRTRPGQWPGDHWACQCSGAGRTVAGRAPKADTATAAAGQ